AVTVPTLLSDQPRPDLQRSAGHPRSAARAAQACTPLRGLLPAAPLAAWEVRTVWRGDGPRDEGSSGAFRVGRRGSPSSPAGNSRHRSARCPWLGLTTVQQTLRYGISGISRRQVSGVSRPAMSEQFSLMTCGGSRRHSRVVPSLLVDARVWAAV